jgi:Flp pilus assembly protein TadG
MTRRRGRSRGQALVEFAIALPIFLVLMMGIFDLGRAIYQYNGVSEAAREIARVTSVHPGTTLGNSTETAAVVATQKGLIPNLASPTFTCIDIDGSTLNTSTTCVAGNQVKVVIVAPYRPVTPLLGLIGTWNMQSTSAVSIQ